MLLPCTYAPTEDTLRVSDSDKTLDPKPNGVPKVSHCLRSAHAKFSESLTSVITPYTPLLPGQITDCVVRSWQAELNLWITPSESEDGGALVCFPYVRQILSCSSVLIVFR